MAHDDALTVRKGLYDGNIDCKPLTGNHIIHTFKIKFLIRHSHAPIANDDPAVPIAHFMDLGQHIDYGRHIFGPDRFHPMQFNFRKKLGQNIHKVHQDNAPSIHQFLFFTQGIRRKAFSTAGRTMTPLALVYAAELFKEFLRLIVQYQAFFRCLTQWGSPNVWEFRLTIAEFNLID